MSKNRHRVDSLLFERGLVPSRQKAKALVMAGCVWHNQVRVDKAGKLVNSDYALTIKTKSNWVARSAGKLEAALEHFKYNVENKTILDIGSSTGGFTEILLKQKASKVIAVDVGRGLMHERIRNNPKVTLLEGVNARYLYDSSIIEKVDAMTIDVSFIGLTTILPAPLSLLKTNSWVIALIKPQFEVGKKLVARGGIVKDPHVRLQSCINIKKWLINKNWSCDGLLASPVLGKQGNQEFLIGIHR